MKHYKAVEIPARTEQQHFKTTCDMCSAEIVRARFEVDEVTVKHRTGNSYPEGGSGDEVSVDLCGSCFDDKLIPFLKSQGVTPSTKEWDW